jgi:acetolactate synthase-1/2/3 large subunit
MNGGEALLTGLKRSGVDYFFANPGTEFVSVIRGFQRLNPEALPRPVLVPHEFQAVSMAYGYYLANHRAQAVMTHANVGAANALIGLIGAARMNIPLIFVSGMTSQSERGRAGHRDKLIHWAQDCRDQGAMFREYVKWEAEITDPASIFDVLERAHSIAMTHPRGPVAVKVAREVLLDEAPVLPERPPPSTASASAPEDSALSTVKEWLNRARRPVVVTNRLGVDARAVAALREFSERHEAGVLTPEDFYVSFPGDHRNHLGYRPGPALKQADFVLVLDCDAPWYPLGGGPAGDAKIVHAGHDPHFSSLPLRGHAGDLYLTCSPETLLRALIEETPPPMDILGSRGAWLSGMLRPRAELGKEETLNAGTISAALAEALDESMILVNELGLCPERLRPARLESYFRSGSASPLGWGMGCALGLALAKPGKTVIAAVGDGVFFLSPVLSALQTAVQQKTPFVILILNNGGMNSIAASVRAFFPDAAENLPLTRFDDGALHLEQAAAIAGGLGLRARTVSELRAALDGAVAFCRDRGRPAIVNAIF